MRHDRISFAQAAEDGRGNPVGFANLDVAGFIGIRIPLHKNKSPTLILLQCGVRHHKLIRLGLRELSS